MVDESDGTSAIVIDASPLIYLAKLGAMDAIRLARRRALITEAVREETTRPALVYRHADALTIETAMARGDIVVTSLSEGESGYADGLQSSVPGLGLGEAQVLAVAHERSIPAVVFERRGQAIARGRSIQLLDLIELLFDGTRQNDLLETRVRRLAEMVNMRIGDFEQVRDRIARRRVG